MVTPSLEESRRQLRERTDRLLVERLNSAFWVILFALALYALRDIRLMSSEIPRLYLIKGIEVAALIAVQLALRDRAIWPRITSIAVLCISSLYVMTAASALLRHDITSTPLAFTVIALVSAALLPWGLGAQLASVVVATVALLWNLYGITGSQAASIGYPTVAMVIACVTSLYVAYQLQRHRDAAEESNLALRASEERYRLMAENATDVIFRCTPEGRILYMSPACRVVTGYEPEEMIGRSVSDFAHPDELEETGQNLAAVHAAGSHTVRFRIRRKDGTYVWIEATTRDVPDPTTGAVREIVAVARDITERRRAEEGLRRSEQHFRSLIEKASDLITVVDPDGAIRYQSPSVTRTTGYAPDELIGTNAFDLIHPDDKAKALSGFMRRINQLGNEEPLLIRTRHKNGAWRLMETLASPLPEGASLGPIVINSRDVTERKQAEAALKESEERYRLASRATNDAIWDWDLLTDVVTWNDGVQRLFGYAAAAVGPDVTWWSEQIHVEDRERVVCGIHAVIDGGGQHWSDEYRYRCVDGAYAVVIDRGYVVRDEHGEPVRMIGAMADVTERKRAEAALRESEERYRDLFENASDIVFTQDLNWDFTWINRATELLTGYTCEEARGRNGADIIAPEHVGRAVEATRRKLAGKLTPAYEVDLISKDGRRFTVELNSRIIYQNGQPVGIQGIARDVTARKRAEAALQQAKDAAEAASRAKSEFLANVSHEIRTPMNGILGMTDLTLHTDLTSEQREYLEMVKSSGESLLTVINDILDFSKIEAGKLQIEHTEYALRPHLESVLKGFSIRAREKGLALHWDIDPAVPDALIGDPDRLRQILVNLVGNAIKFTERGEVTVQVGSRQSTVVSSQPPVELHFSVRDTGIGIPPDKQRAIFDAFEQVDGSATRQYGGTGLGLAISKMLVDMMGGHIWVESAGGGGSTFHFTVRLEAAVGHQPPAVSEQPAAVVAQASVPASLRVGAQAGTPFLSTVEGPASPIPLRVLVVEDNLVNQKLVVRLLQKRGHCVAIAGNGREALAALEREGFDLVLMDVQMPEMDGFEATAEIRRREQQWQVTSDKWRAKRTPGENGGHQPSAGVVQASVPAFLSEGAQAGTPAPPGTGRTTHLPIIALTAHAMKGDEERCLAAGMDGYIAKPIDAKKLFQLLDSLVPATAPSARARLDASPPVTLSGLAANAMGGC